MILFMLHHSNVPPLSVVPIMVISEPAVTAPVVPTTVNVAPGGITNGKILGLGLSL